MLNLRNPIIFSGVRDGGDDTHIECRFADGQKYAAILIPKSSDEDDSDEDRLAFWIVRALANYNRLVAALEESLQLECDTDGFRLTEGWRNRQKILDESKGEPP